MRLLVVFCAVLLAASACTAPSSQPASTSLTSVTALATPVAPVSTSVSAPDSTTTPIVADATLFVAYGLDGPPRQRSMRYFEVFAFAADDSDTYPTEVVADAYETPVEGRVLFEGTVRPGTYEVRSFQRTCGDSCDEVGQPSDGCATRLAVESGAVVRATIVDRPDSGCDFDVDGTQEGEPLYDMGLTLEAPGKPGCAPPSPIGGNVLSETIGTSDGETVGWGLLWDEPPIPVGRLSKMVFRFIGEGEFDVQAIHDDGTAFTPQWGPNEHGYGSVSSYGRPGWEWGMAFNFPKVGCWNIHFTIGTDSVDVWVTARE